ncbi:Cof subfamily protein (haloacid dehalogenase superfamily) [Bacillus ectoiniformans]|uniref:Cof-type HAD-IIB family hydrolase n=1 Tax=Bacillus ectoiniformans TaxID=1494429 RepID=UPI0019586C21|nr:Cof-type HAD-IIB family hydrolase [Bacillus ectoiniformans]MBM7647286.1 Cof subfamily protein (haloacid dehalogenase superfamily) [Bacillus ectoiniformans]
MKKLVFFDIDGTLYDRDKRLPEKTKEALQLLREKGVYTAIATGRAPFMYEDLRKELDIHSFVSFNGQYVVFEDEVIYLNPLAVAPLEKLAGEAKKKQHPLVYMNEATMKASHKDHAHIEESLRSLKFNYPDQHDEFYKESELYQSLVFCEEKDEDYYRENYPEFTFIRWHKYSVDILPAGGSKAEGIKKMMERLDFDIENVYAFGDGLNDREMLQMVGTGVAMGNALPEVKKCADLVTDDVEEDGIYNGLKKLGLI